LNKPDFVAGWPETVTRERRRGRVGYCHNRMDPQYAARGRVRAEIRPGEELDALCGRTSEYPYGPARGDLRLSLRPILRRALAGEEGGFERA
jgi:hypothetical protein